MTRLSFCVIGTMTFLLAGNTLACDGGCSGWTACPPQNCVTSVCNCYAGCGASVPSVGCGTTVTHGCSSCGDGSHQVGGSIGGTGSTGGNGGGPVNNGGGAVNNGGNNLQLDPDVLTGLTGDLSQPVSTRQSHGGLSAERIWTDSSGKHQRVARFVRLEGTLVILQNAQGRTSRVELQMLSATDQRLVSELSPHSNPGQQPGDQGQRVATRRPVREF